MYTALTFKGEKRGFGKDSVARCMTKKGMLLFWVLAAVIMWEGHNPPGLWVQFGFGPKSGGFVVQKRNETPETPETLETPETPDVDAGIAFL